MLDVVNVKDGRRLGPIKDLDLDLEKGIVKAMVVADGTAPKSWSFFSGGRNEDVFIPWERVKKIGVDVILVDVRDIPGFDEEAADYR
jgi:YlmC/YmxH family sporulation protein